MRFLFLALILFFSGCCSWKNIPESSSFREPINRDLAVYRADLLQPQFAPGIKGKALDLSADALLRMPARLDSNSHVDYQQETSFSFQIWVKTKKNAPQGTPIAGNKPANQLLAKLLATM